MGAERPTRAENNSPAMCQVYLEMVGVLVSIEECRSWPEWKRKKAIDWAIDETTPFGPPTERLDFLPNPPAG